jgi:hypothetical protein
MRRARGFGSPFAEHCGLSNQLVRRLCNHAVPIKSRAIGFLRSRNGRVTDACG